MNHKLIMENWRRFINEKLAPRAMPSEWWQENWNYFLDVMRQYYPDVYESGIVEDAIAHADSQNFESKSQAWYLSALGHIEKENPEAYNGSKANTDIHGEFVPNLTKRTYAADEPEPEPDFQILSPVLKGTDYNMSGREFVVVKTPSYGNIIFYKSTGGGTGEGSAGLWVPTAGLSQHTRAGGTFVTKMLKDHPESCKDANIDSCKGRDGKLIRGKMPNPSGEFGKASDYIIEQNLSPSVTALSYAESSGITGMRNTVKLRGKWIDNPYSKGFSLDNLLVGEIAEAFEGGLINHFLKSHGAQIGLEGFSGPRRPTMYYGVEDVFSDNRKKRYHKFGEGE